MINESDYKKRIIDNKIKEYLEIVKAILIVGPKWCGKTWTGFYHSNSQVSLMDKNTIEYAKIDPNYILNENYPQLIDEWQVVPEIRDAVRNKCDSDSVKGKYILTGSTTVNDENKNVIKHSGIGRIIPLTMFPLTVFEQQKSTKDISLLDMKNKKVVKKIIKGLSLTDYAELIVKGGFPDNVEVPIGKATILPKKYLESICYEDVIERKKYKKSPSKLKSLLSSLARNESTVVNNAKIIKDISEDDSKNGINNINTLNEYLDYLDSIYVLWYQKSFSCNYRSKSRIGIKAKRHFVDPSLAAAALNLTPQKLMDDFNTFGFLFESLVERDLKVFMDYYEGELFHFRDNLSGDEVDAICEFSDGTYGAIEIKLSPYRIEEAKKSLTKFSNNVTKKPVFKCIIVGEYDVIDYDEENDIYIVPFNALGIHEGE